MGQGPGASQERGEVIRRTVGRADVCSAAQIGLSDKSHPGMALFLSQALYLNPFRQLREKDKFFLSPLGLNCFWLKVIHMPKCHTLGRLIPNPFTAHR